MAFSAVVAESADRWVALDTAPTSHTLLLLDATGSYHRELMRQACDGRDATTLERLQDSAVTRPIMVTLPETTPVLEAQGLARDLERAGITPAAWVINQSLAVTETTSPFLRQQARAQAEVLRRIVAGTQAPVYQLPYRLR